MRTAEPSDRQIDTSSYYSNIDLFISLFQHVVQATERLGGVNDFTLYLILADDDTPGRILLGVADMYKYAVEGRDIDETRHIAVAEVIRRTL